MCSFIRKIQKKALLAQSLVVLSLKPMGCINIQPWESESDSFLVVVISQGIQVQCWSTCPVPLAAVKDQQLHQKLFSEALTFFQRSLLDYAHLHHTVHWWKNWGVICLLNFTVVLLHESFCTWSHNSYSSGSGPLAGRVFCFSDY